MICQYKPAIGTYLLASFSYQQVKFDLFFCLYDLNQKNIENDPEQSS